MVEPKIIIEGTHLTYRKTAEEEIELLQTGDENHIFNYICSCGIQTLEGQQELLSEESGHLKYLRWVKLQHMLHFGDWEESSMWNQLRKFGIVYSKEKDEEKLKSERLKTFYAMLNVGLNQSLEDTHQQIAKVVAPSITEEFEEKVTKITSFLLLFPKQIDAKYWEILNDLHRGKWSLEEEIKFIQHTPIEYIYRYINFYNLQSQEAEEALLRRGDSTLSWYYISIHAITNNTLILLRDSGNRFIYRYAFIRSHETDPYLEKKYGSITKTIEALEKMFDRKYFPDGYQKRIGKKPTRGTKM